MKFDVFLLQFFYKTDIQLDTFLHDEQFFSLFDVQEVPVFASLT